MDDSPEIRRARPGDEAALKTLWHTVFGDDPALIDDFFRLLCPPGAAAAAFRNGRLASAGYCLHGAEAGKYPCAYIYAMATFPEFRGQGLAAAVGRRLTADAFAAGVRVVATLPAEPSLRAWYARALGMRPSFRNGGAGVTFPEPWRRFAARCGPAEGGAPDRLMAVCAPGCTPEDFLDTGWALTLA